MQEALLCGNDPSASLAPALRRPSRRPLCWSHRILTTIALNHDQGVKREKLLSCLCRAGVKRRAPTEAAHRGALARRPWRIAASAAAARRSGSRASRSSSRWRAPACAAPPPPAASSSTTTAPSARRCCPRARPSARASSSSSSAPPATGRWARRTSSAAAPSPRRPSAARSRVSLLFLCAAPSLPPLAPSLPCQPTFCLLTTHNALHIPTNK